MGERNRSFESTVIDPWEGMTIAEGSMLELAEVDPPAYTKEVAKKIEGYRKRSEKMGREMRNASIVAFAMFLSLAAGGAERTGMFKDFQQRSTESGAGSKPVAKQMETTESAIPNPQREAAPIPDAKQEYFEGDLADLNEELKALEALVVQQAEPTEIEITEFPKINTDLE